MSNNNQTNEISKIKLSDKIYEIKDAELREMLEILLGNHKN